MQPLHGFSELAAHFQKYFESNLNVATLHRGKVVLADPDKVTCIRKTNRIGHSSIPYLWHIWDTHGVKQEAVRTTVDIPASLYRRLKEQAAAQGRSVRELILAGAKRSLVEGKRPRLKRVRFPLIVSKGPKVDLTNEDIYEYVEFP
jgi:hypothetical protein